MSVVNRQEVKTMLDIFSQLILMIDYDMAIYNHLFVSQPTDKLHILLVTRRSFDDIPFSSLRGDNLSEASIGDLGLGDPDGFPIGSSNVATSRANHRPHNEQAFSPSSRELELFPSILHSSQAVSAPIPEGMFLDLGCFPGCASAVNSDSGREIVPWLQSLRSFIIVVNNTLNCLVLEFVLTISSSCDWQSLRMHSYIVDSSVLRTTGTIFVTKGGRFNCASVRRIQITRMSDLRFLNESSDSEQMGFMICSLKYCAFENGSKRRNFRSDLRSSILF